MFSGHLIDLDVDHAYVRMTFFSPGNVEDLVNRLACGIAKHDVRGCFRPAVVEEDDEEVGLVEAECTVGVGLENAFVDLASAVDLCGAVLIGNDFDTFAFDGDRERWVL